MTMTQDRIDATEALMVTSRLMTAVVARTLASVDDSVSVPQLRVLVMLWNGEPMNLSAIADALGVNPSNATRTCDKLEAAGLVARNDHAEDRRQVAVSLTEGGRRQVDVLMDARQALLDELVAEMSQRDQRSLRRGLTALLAVAESSEVGVRVGTAPGAILPWIG